MFTPGGRFSPGTLEFLQQNPWLTRPERLWLLQTWSTCKRDPLAVDFVSDNPPSSSPPPFSPPLSLSLSTSCNHDYKGKLICSKRTKCTPWGLSVAFPPPMRDSRSSFHWHPTTLPRSIACPRSLTSSTLPAFTKGLIQDRCFVLVCSTTWQQEQRGGGGEVKRFMRTLLLVFEVPGW